MTHDEVKNIVHALTVYYPTSAPKTERGMIELVKLWEMAIGQFDYKFVEGCVIAYTLQDKDGFFPNPGKIVNIIDQATTNGLMTEGEAWDMVRKAIRRGSYHSEEDFAKFPDVIKKAVGSPNQIYVWATSTNFNDGVAQSNFLRAYRTELERERKLSYLPDGIKQMIEQTNKNLLEVQNGKS